MSDPELFQHTDEYTYLINGTAFKHELGGPCKPDILHGSQNVTSRQDTDLKDLSWRESTQPLSLHGTNFVNSVDIE